MPDEVQTVHSQTRRKVRWQGKNRESKPGPKKGRPLLTPEHPDYKPLGDESTVARRAKVKRERQKAEAEWLANHFQLEGTRYGAHENSTNLTIRQRMDRQEALVAFPRIPDHELQELQRLIGAYGLPIARMDSDTAAFVLRRVLLDYFKLNILRRATKPPMFTPEELLALLRAMKLQPVELAHMTSPNNHNAGLGNIMRWLNGGTHPTGIHAMKVNRMIEQHVRRKPSGGNPSRQAKNRSENPETIKRAIRRARTRTTVDAPLASAAKQAMEAEEEGDAGGGA